MSLGEQRRGKSLANVQRTLQAEPAQLDGSLASPTNGNKRIEREAKIPSPAKEEELLTKDRKDPKDDKIVMKAESKTSSIGTVTNTPLTKAPWLSELIKKFSLSELIKKLRKS